MEKSQSFDKNSEIGNQEFLYKAVYRNKLHWSRRYDIPASTNFEDPGGVSVERTGDRDEDDIIAFFKKYFKGYLIKLNCGECRRIDTYPIPKPSKRSAYHSEIHDSPDQVLIQPEKREELAKISITVVSLDDE